MKMKEEHERTVEKYEAKFANLIWTLLRNNKVNTALYLLIFFYDFCYKLIMMLEIFSTKDCLPFDFQPLSSIYSEEKLHQLSITSITLSAIILTLLISLIALLFQKKKRVRRQDHSEHHQSTIYQVLSFILTMIKVGGFTFILHLLFNQILLSDLSSSTLGSISLVFSILGLILLVLLQYVLATFFNFVLLHENLPFAETSYKPHINDLLYKVVLVLAFQFREKNQVLYSLATITLLIQVYQVYIRLRKSFIIQEAIHKLCMLESLLQAHLLLMLIISPLYQVQNHYFYFVLALLPAPVMLWLYLTSFRRVKMINILNSVGKATEEETIISLIGLVEKLERSKKNEDKAWINCMEELHVSICSEYYQQMQRRAQKDKEKELLENADGSQQDRETEKAEIQDVTFQHKQAEEKPKQQAVPEGAKKKKKDLYQSQGKGLQKYLQIAKHLFKDHVLIDSQVHYLISLIQIWYIQLVLENPYLTLFLILTLKEKKKDRSFVENFTVRVVFKYIEELVSLQYLSQQSLKEIDIQHILTVDEMSSQFEQRLWQVTLDIENFWKQLLNDNQNGKTFKEGIALAVGMKKTEELCADIQNEYHSKNHNQAYYKMVLFNRIVLCKGEEALNLKVSSLDRGIYLKELELQNEKGLLVVNYALKQQMPVIFVNNFMMKLVGSSRDEFLQKPVNQIMPALVSDNHTKFIDAYVKTWKPAMTCTKSQIFIKDNQNLLQSVHMQTQPNIANTSQIVLIVDSDRNFSPFEEEVHHKSTAFLIMDSDFQIKELSKNFYRMTGVNYEVIKEYSERFERCLQLEDLLQISSLNDTTQLNDYSKELQLNQFYRAQFRLYGLSNDKMEAGISKDMFTLTVLQYSFMQGAVNMYVVALQIHHEYSNIEISDNGGLAGSLSRVNSKVMDGIHDTALLMKSEFVSSQSNSQLQNDMSSKSSSSGKLFSQLQNRSLEFTNIINKTSTPLTLTFINQISLVILMIILVSSAITLGLILKSQENASTGIIVNFIALKRINGFSQSRTLLRTLGNIANGYIDNNSSLIENRFEYYLPLFEKAVTQMNDNNIELSKYQVDSPILAHLEYSSITMLQKNLTMIKYNFTTNYAVNQYTNAGFETYNKIKEMGMEYLQSDIGFMQIAPSNRTEATLDERNYFIVLQQAKDNLYFQTRTYSQNFILYENQEIEDKAQYTKILTFVCIALIGASAISLIPFFMKVQKRIYQLLEIFFYFDKESIREVLTRIQAFKGYLESQKKNKGEQIQLEQLEQEISLPTVLHPERQTRRVLGSTRRNEVDSKRRLKESEREEEKEREKEKEESRSEDMEFSKKKKDKHKKQLNEAFDQTNIQKNISQRHLNQYLNKRNAAQIALIVLLALVASFFFLIQYIQSLRSFEEMNSSINSMNDIGLKTFITGGLIYSIMENHLTNVTTQAVNNEGFKMSMALFLIGDFEEYDTDYVVRVLKEQSGHLGDSLEYINLLESDQFCSVVFGNSSRSQEYNSHSEYAQEAVEGVYKPMSVEECEELAVANQGLNAIFTRLYVQSQQLIITYDAMGESRNRTEEFLRGPIRGELADMDDIYYIFCTNQVSVLLNMAYDGIISYFEKVTKQFILIYICFLLTMGLVFIVMKLSVLSRLRNEMHLSNKLLYIIDFEGQSDQEQQKILKFLKEY